MNNSPNDPSINRLYNYVYKITNLLNGKIYIGVHRTDNLDDNYMGSGKHLKYAINKHGIDNFKKDYLVFFNTYQEALDYEKLLVNEEFIEREDTYNLKTGGYGLTKWSTTTLKLFSTQRKEQWQDPVYREKMMTALTSVDRCSKISKNIKRWINNNPEKHAEKMHKINTNPEKKRKTADKHRGMIRSEESKKRMSEAALLIAKDPIIGPKRSGKGTNYAYNPKTGDIIRIASGQSIPQGWVRGSGPKKNPDSYKDMNKGTVFGYNPNTGQIRRFKSITELENTIGYIKGRPPTKRTT